MFEIEEGKQYTNENGATVTVTHVTVYVEGATLYIGIRTLGDGHDAMYKSPQHNNLLMQWQPVEFPPVYPGSAWPADSVAGTTI